MGLPFLIGVTGSIGSGKSTVVRLLGELGAGVVSLDDVGHEILKDEEVKDALLKAFGKGILSPDGEVDRRKLAQKSFSTPESVRLLNDITHPKIERRLKSIVEEEGKKGTEFLVIESPLLIEVGSEDFYDFVILVVADLDKRVCRVKDRGWDKEELHRRERFFVDEEIKRRHANLVIHNNGSLEELRKKVKEAWSFIISLRDMYQTTS